jgi:hypothetical protein
MARLIESDTIKKVYVSGPMTGKKNNNVEAFNTVTAELRDLGYVVINPAELDDGEDKSDIVSGDSEWVKCLKRDIRKLLNVDAVVVLKGWKNSKGALLEVLIAYELSKPVYSSPGFRTINPFPSGTPYA